VIDTNAILRAYLVETGTLLHTLCGTRIYIPRIPPGFDNAQAAVEATGNGSGFGADKVHTDVVADYHIKCFGGTTDHGAARAVYGALADRLHRAELKKTAHGFISCAYQQADAQDLFDPDVGWPFVLASFRVRMRPL